MTQEPAQLLSRKHVSDHLPGDLLGGLMGAIVALPISMAFGVASGLGAAAGLYGAIACGIFAALFGGTRGQCSGPTGPMTVAAAAVIVAHPGRPELLFAATVVAGIVQIVLGKVRMGELIRYIPYPVLSGFMTGIGLIIICLQLHPFFGVKGTGNVLESLQSLPQLLSGINTRALGVGVLSLGIIYALPRIAPRAPSALVALIATTVASVWLVLDLPRIGSIPSGVPIPKLPMFGFMDLHVVLVSGLSLAVLGSLDSLLTSLVVDRMTGTRHDSDRELAGQGVGNIVAGLIGGLPGAGATMRSLANIKSGGTTNLSGVVHGLILLAILLGLGQIAAQIPLSCLAAILISVGIAIIDRRGIKSIKDVPKSDVAVMLTVLFLTVFGDLITAVGVGIALASVLFVKKLSDANLFQFGTLDSLEHLHELSERIPAEMRKTVAIYSFHGPLFFGEAKNFTEAMCKLPDVQYVLLCFYSIPIIDQSWAYALEDTMKQLKQRGVKILFVGLPGIVRQALGRIGVIEHISEDMCFDTFEHAIESVDITGAKKLERRLG